MWIPRTSDVDRGLDGITQGGKSGAFVESSPHPARLAFGMASAAAITVDWELGYLSAIPSRFRTVGMDRSPSGGLIFRNRIARHLTIM